MASQSRGTMTRREGSERGSERSGEHARRRLERGSSRASDPVILGLGRVLAGLCGLLLLGLVVMAVGIVSDGIDWDSPVMSAKQEDHAGAVARGPANQPADARPTAEVVRFDLSKLNDEGLIGPSAGLRSLSYEFCIPASEAHLREVQAIDASVTFRRGSRGRIGCGEDEALVIGNTHQRGFREVLNRLAGLPYVERIEETDLE